VIRSDAAKDEFEGRRFRPYFFYCLNNCLWEFNAARDLDGWGGGNAKNATGEYGSWFCNVDNRAAENGCSRYRVRDKARGGGRQTLYDTGSDSIGDGLHIAHGPGVVYNVGPYTLRAMGPLSAERGPRQDDRQQLSIIGHDLFLWSPKGFLTGSATTAGSILIGAHSSASICHAKPVRGAPGSTAETFAVHEFC
jgi:hypothetical protein